MEKLFNYIKLGIFVLAGLVFLIVLLYFIGVNKSYFGSNYVLKARFQNVQGLQKGNNVRYSGIDIGTVKSIQMINDTTVEVSMLVKANMKIFIRKNARVSIGMDGFVGNKVVLIMPTSSDAEYASDNDLLPTKPPIDTDEIIHSFLGTLNSIRKLADTATAGFSKLNQSKSLWSLANDPKLFTDIRESISNFKKLSEKTSLTAEEIEVLISGVQKGEGNLGKLFKDSVAYQSLLSLMQEFKQAGSDARQTLSAAQVLLTKVDSTLLQGKGVFPAAFKDSSWKIQVDSTLRQINRSSKQIQGLSTALQKSFLFRGYFKRNKE